MPTKEEIYNEMREVITKYNNASIKFIEDTEGKHAGKNESFVIEFNKK